MKRQTVFAVVTVALSASIAALVLELGGRVARGRFELNNFLTAELDLFQSRYPSAFDQRLGWIPKPGSSGNRNVWGTEVTIRADGTRENGPSPVSEGDNNAVLTVGDSFTFGDEVSDSETWPAVLEHRLGTRVVNGGVFGYGIDQAVLRAEALRDRYHPAWLIVSLIGDDVQRAGLTRRTNVAKPYFEVRDTALTLRTDHIVPPQRTSSQLGWFRRIAGYSYLVHVIASRLAPSAWFEGARLLGEQSLSGHDPVAVTCLLMRRIRAWPPGGRVTVLAQYSGAPDTTELQLTESALTCAREAGLETLDLRSALEDVRTRDAQRYAAMFNVHMTAAGNAFVAEQLAAYWRSTSAAGSERPGR